MSGEKKPIIIKKVKKVEEGGHHGGAWKIAYADFVTAMMAFFLVMWLLNMTSEEKRAKIAMYFRTFSIFEKAGGSIMEGGTGKPFEKDKKGESQIVEKIEVEIAAAATEGNADKVKESLMGVVKTQLQEFSDQIVIATTPEGIRIDIIDKSGNPIFSSGSSSLNKNGKDILKVLSNTLNELSNKIVIEGHTDAATYRGDRNGNWDLSIQRANAARAELLINGFDPNKISSVAGYAATKPIVKDNPNDPANRRISFLILYQKAGQFDNGTSDLPPALK
ncbi:MAG: OmpA family protein [Calditerrivibrio sp.]|nr:OmpA family protein [Calditerrivibrio sp.]MCA1932046.1 OmpA family protein [Calditerrivibrio sp.]